ncbi:MAG TPA: HAMP domain-containing sensor histidine kinase [Steroidobacteraceae bacterium]|nr:HAMP domain-containing sensor histidine kinase [Steroidobacteraceae bacterium]
MSLGALAVATGSVLLDGLTTPALNVSTIYCIPLLLAAIARRQRLLWGILCALLCATFAVHAAQMARAGLSWAAPFFRSRLMSAMTMLLVACILHRWTRALEGMEARDRALNEQNAQLTAAQRELIDQQQQIRQQNAELKRRREQAEELSARKTVQLASMSHDIRTPLACIDLTAQAIARIAKDPTASARIPQLAQQLCANALSATHQATGILDFAALEQGRLEVQRSEFALEQIIRQQCELLRPMATAKALELLFDPPLHPICIYADRLKLERVLTNLITNAIKYTDAGFVRIRAGRLDDGGIWVRVHDSGIGIAPEDAGRIFNEFDRSQPGKGDIHSGWGLGLSICRRMTELMGGTIGVESSSGNGSVFLLTLPPRCGEPASENIQAMDTGSTLSAAHDCPPTAASTRGSHRSGSS